MLAGTSVLNAENSDGAGQAGRVAPAGRAGSPGLALAGRAESPGLVPAGRRRAASEADHVRHRPGAGGLVGREDHADHADAPHLAVDRALAGDQAVHEVRDLRGEGLALLVLEDLLLLAAHLHPQGRAVRAERALLAHHREAVRDRRRLVRPGGHLLTHRTAVDAHQHLRRVLTLHYLQAMGGMPIEGNGGFRATVVTHTVGGVRAGVD